MLDLIGAQTPPSVKARQVISRGVEQLTRMVDDLSEVLPIGADKVSIEPDEVDLAEVVRDCVEATLDTAKEASIEMEQVAYDSIPVRADATRMRQV